MRIEFFCLVLLFVANAFGLENPSFETKEGANASTSVPVTGHRVPNVELLDEVMLKYRAKIDCTAATLAISKNGQMLYRRGYGWQDREKTISAEPDIMIGIASCDKPIIAAGIRRLARQKEFQIDEKLFDVLPIQPQGSIVDERIKMITINHVIDHTAGWGSDPRNWATELAHNAGVKNPIPMEILLGFVMTRQLEDAPGSISKYCNFGYDTLRYIIEKKTGKTFTDYACIDLLGLSSVKGVHSPSLPPEQNDLPLIWNYREGGPVSTSARILCRFMERYWLTGEPRKEGNPYWVMYGSLDGSTAMMVWRSDGINLVALFNGRGGGVGHDEIKNDLEKVIDQINKEK
jgi:CubicO group peptidase (beta-lactamase class C family)